MRLLLPMPGNEAFTASLARETGAPVGKLETRTFPDGETYVRLLCDPAGREVDIVCTLARPNGTFLPLVFAADAARELGATAVRLVAPYLAYMRQDARFQPGEAVTSGSFARMLGGAFDGLVTVDPHLHRNPDLSALYRIPAQTVPAAPAIAEWIRANVAEPVIVGPDIESEQWASHIGALCGAPWRTLRKTRLGDRSVTITAPDLSDCAGRTPVLVDDIASSGRTLAAAARVLESAGLPRPVCVVVHAIFAEDALQRLDGLVDRIVSTDSIVHSTNAIAVAPLVGPALLDLS